MVWLAVLLVIAWLLGWGVFHVAGGCEKHEVFDVVIETVCFKAQTLGGVADAEVETISMRHIEAYLTGNRQIDETIEAFDQELSRAMSRVRW